jgi:hypothetical protein
MPSMGLDQADERSVHIPLVRCKQCRSKSFGVKNAYLSLNFAYSIVHALIGERSFYCHGSLDGGTELSERTFGRAI